VQTGLFVCKLNLVKYGLLREAKDIDDITHATQIDILEENDEDKSEDETQKDQKAIMAKREQYVRDSINRAGMDGRISTAKTEATVNARQAVIREFMHAITSTRKCRNCQGINPKYRKDRFVKIFRKPLSEKERLKMIQSGHTARDALLQLKKMERSEAGKKRKREDSDEGVADMGGSSDEEEVVEEEEESEEEVEIAGGDAMFDQAAGEERGKGKKKAPEKEEYLNPSRVHAQLVQLFDKESEVFSLVYGTAPDSLSQQLRPAKRSKTASGAAISPSGSAALTADMFFITDILVPPNRYRPENRTANDEIAEAQENTNYKNILNHCDAMVQIRKEIAAQEDKTSGDAILENRRRLRTYADLENTWVQLQEAVNSLQDRDKNPLQGAAGRRNPDGVKQKLEKKEGMFRKYMMGKRVNFAARTVISPDPNIETNEIGVPPVFAIKLTYPEAVTQWNFEELQLAVKNGAHVWPGAVAVEDERGRVVTLERKNPEERVSIANSLLAPTPGTTMRGTRPKKVHRHLNNGDIVIMNRQPTLHKPSMMCHRAKVLPGEKTLRMHYTNCNTYNADFDGDEMNLHFPQNELARAEALGVADTDHQYLSSTAGNPLRGLIQDHISMGVHLTKRDSLFDRSEVMQLLYAALRPEQGHCARGRVEMCAPAIWKPKQLWTGKQIITCVLMNMRPDSHQGLTMSGNSTTEGNMWGAEGQAEENEVVVSDGYFCQGILDKKQIGPSSGGFINAVYEAYGHVVAGRLLSVLGRLLTRLLVARGFSCGVEDLMFTPEGEAARREELKKAETIGLEVASKYVGLADQNIAAGDCELRRRLEDVLREDSKQAGLDQITNAATKDITSAISSATLPNALKKPFPHNQMQTMTASGAKGSKVNASQISCNLGQQVLEGRRVPIMVSGKTLPCFQPFESSVRAGGYITDRFLTGVRPQEYFFHAMAGREGLIDTAVKTSRSGYLQRCVIKGMEGLRVEHDSSVRDSSDGSMIQFLYGEDALDVAKAKYLPDFKFTAENHLSLFENLGMREEWTKVLSEDAMEWNKSAERKYRKTGNLGAIDPALSVFNPSTHGGSTSEKLYRASRVYADENPDKLLRDKKKNIEGVGLSKKNFQAILDVRYLKSVVEAGEAVGVVAGQSIGEPSTQMTLNTFHLAGHSAKNVTLGIPRLREIVMTAAKVLATPTMTLKMNDGINVEDAKKFAKGISKLSLAEIVDKVTVTERVGKGVAYGEARKYEIRLELFPRAEYEREYAITVQDVISAIEHRFLPDLQKQVRKAIKQRGDEQTLKAAIGKSAGRIEEETNRPEAENEGGEEDSDGDDDGDATNAKSKKNEMQAGYEAEEDDDEREMVRKNAKQAQDEQDDDEPEDEAYVSDRSTPGPEEAGRAERSAAKDRENRIRGDKRTNDITQFSFNDKAGDLCTFTMEYDSTATKILMLRIVEAVARNAVIQCVPGLTACMVDEAALKIPNTAVTVVTSGVNLPSMWEYQHIVHPHHIYTNSIHDILVNYGVEAARNVIVLELQSVFSGHGISVDARHLTLIADYMTRDGRYQAFSRMGYRGNTSPFMKMSFETTVGFLKEAMLHGETEELKGPSSRIVVGGLSSVGTGAFDVFTPVVQNEEDVDMVG
jgi:DNA-directed RNA polymerase beta' subunit